MEYIAWNRIFICEPCIQNIAIARLLPRLRGWQSPNLIEISLEMIPQGIRMAAMNENVVSVFVIPNRTIVVLFTVNKLDPYAHVPSARISTHQPKSSGCLQLYD